jgi:hypothetical protein
MANRVPFPNRFYAAVGFAANPPLGARAVSDETRLLLYALYQQVRAPSNLRRVSPDVESELARISPRLVSDRRRAASSNATSDRTLTLPAPLFPPGDRRSVSRR